MLKKIKMYKIHEIQKLVVLKEALKDCEQRQRKGHGFLICIRISEWLRKLYPEARWVGCKQIGEDFGLLKFKPHDKKEGDEWWPNEPEFTTYRIQIIKQLIFELEVKNG